MKKQINGKPIAKTHTCVKCGKEHAILKEQKDYRCSDCGNKKKIVKTEYNLLKYFGTW